MTAAFDIWESLAQPASGGALGDLIDDLLDQVAPSVSQPVVGGAYIPLVTTLHNQGDALDVRVTMALSSGAWWEDAEPPLTTTDPTRPSWSLSLLSDQTQAMRLGIRAPAATTRVRIQTDLADPAGTETIGTHSFEFDTVAAADLLEQARLQIEALAPATATDQDQRDEALAALGEAQTAYAAVNIEEAIYALLAADRALSGLAMNGGPEARVAVSFALQAVELSFEPLSEEAASLTAVSGDGQITAVGTSFPAVLQALALDEQGMPVTGVSVSFILPAEGAGAAFVGGRAIATVLTGVDGIAVSPALTANTLVGSYEATAQIAGAADVARFTLTNTALPPVLTLRIQSGNNQSTVVEEPFAEPLAVLVKDANGIPVSGVTVTFAAPGSGASAVFDGGEASTMVTTGADGIATAPVLTANEVVGNYSVHAGVEGASNAVDFMLTNIAAPSRKLTLRIHSGNNQSTIVGESFAEPLAVRATDTKGLPAKGLPVSGVTVTFTAPGGGASATFSGGGKNKEWGQVLQSSISTLCFRASENRARTGSQRERGQVLQSSISTREERG